MNAHAWEMWLAYQDEYLRWLRAIPMLERLGSPADYPEAIGDSESPIYLDAEFWSFRTHETEAAAIQYLAGKEIDAVFDTVASLVDEDLTRFDPLVSYYGRFFPDGDPYRIDIEGESAHNMKRDFAWAAIETAIGQRSFFSSLLPWYSRGRWPCRWIGSYPEGHIGVL